MDKRMVVFTNGCFDMLHVGHIRLYREDHKMRKLFLAILLVLMVGVSNSFAELVLAWEPYSDPNATGLRLQSSLDQQTWAALVDNIPTDNIAVAVPNHTADYERVYYRLVAFNATDISDPSNVVSFYWTTGGGGSEGVGSPGNLRFIDCNDPQNPTEQQICTDLGL